MTRYDFLKSMGLTGAALLAALTSCVHEEDSVVNALTLSSNGTASQPTTSTTTSGTTTQPTTSTTTSGTTTQPTSTTGSTTDLSTITNRLLTIDLTSSAASALKTVTGYMIQSGIVIAQVSTGVYVAVTQTCSHEPKKAIIFNKTEFYCTVHGARYDLTGKGKNSFGSRGITVYKVATDGKTLVVYS